MSVRIEWSIRNVKHLAHHDPAFVVVPIKDYATMVAKARGTTRRRTIPHEVVSLMVDGFSAARAWREYRGLTQVAVARRMRITQPALAQI